VELASMVRKPRVELSEARVTAEGEQRRFELATPRMSPSTTMGRKVARGPRSAFGSRQA